MVDLAAFDALTFDCYGTLIDWEAGILAALAPTREEHGVELGDEAVLAAFGRAESACEEASPAASYPEILASVFDRLSDEWDVPRDAEAAAAFAASVGDWPAFADSRDALRYLAEHYTLGILSNVDKASFARSQERLGVAFDEVMTAEEIGSYKPDPRNFEFALERLASRGIERSRVLHVAQSLFHDHVPAKQLGLTTVWVDRRAGKSGSGATRVPEVDVQPDLVVESLAELVRLHRGG